jgi:hypothetical protein
MSGCAQPNFPQGFLTTLERVSLIQVGHPAHLQPFVLESGDPAADHQYDCWIAKTTG